MLMLTERDRVLTWLQAVPIMQGVLHCDIGVRGPGFGFFHRATNFHFYVMLLNSDLKKSLCST